MGAASKFMALVAAPFPYLRPSLVLVHRRLSSVSRSPHRILGVSSLYSPRDRPSHVVKCFHSQPNSNSQSLHSAVAAQPHPWPEWTQFLNVLSSGQGFGVPEDYGIPPEDAFVVYEKLPDDFVRAAASCIVFARSRPDLLRMLSRRDIEDIVSNGTPFLFKSAIDTARRMRAFLRTNGINVAESGTASTVDIMKYIISYASNPTVSSERNGLFSRQAVDSSVRYLLHELALTSTRVSYGTVPASGRQFSHSEMATSGPFGPNIQMKRGDWICPKCNFMNFARNMKCLECEESRPKRLLVGSEWECPQCNFYNYGRNTMCLRCDHSRPGAPLFSASQGSLGNRFFKPSSDHQSSSGMFSEQNNEMGSSQNGYSGSQHGGSNLSGGVPQAPPSSDTFSRQDQSAVDYEKQVPPRETVSSHFENQEVERSEKSERWFKKMVELHSSKDPPGSFSDEEFPEIMPTRNGENRFVVSKTRNRSVTSPKYKRQAAMDEANNAKFVPFVPFPPGYFARKDPAQTISEDSSTVRVNENSASDTQMGLPLNSEPPNVNAGFTNAAPPNDGYSGSATPTTEPLPLQLPESEIFHGGWTGPSLEGSAVKETDPLDMSEEAKAERWFKRVAQIKDISELSQIPDEDFPSIMPMRKGVNRFVVSKRKTPLERRLTSQQRRRNLPVVTNYDSFKRNTENS